MKGQITRREFIGSAAAAACAMMPLPVLSQVARRPDSNFNGVQIGIISYSPMQKGLLSGKMTKERVANFDEDDHRRRDTMFQEPQLSINLDLVEKLRPITKHIPLESVPRCIVMMLQPFAINHFGMKMDEPQLRRLLGDKLWTPHCTFHKVGEIKKWCAEEGLTMTMRKIFYFGYANVMAFRKSGTISIEPTEEVKLRCPKCGNSSLSKTEEVCSCDKCGAEYKKEDGIYRFLDSELR